MRKIKDSGIEWIGDIPKEWTITTIGRLFTAKAGGDVKPCFYSDERDEKHPYPVYTNTLEKNQVYAYTSTPEFPANTITVTGRGEIGHAIYRNVPYDAIIRLNVLLPKFSLDQRYYAYFIDTVVPFFTNSTAIGQLSANQIISYKVCFLPIEEQQKIADFLDEKCEYIDNIISGLEKQIDLLTDYKKSLITETVTKGLNNNVKMKDSGIEWVGDIPEHWRVTKLKYVTVQRNEKGLFKSNQDIYIGLENVMSYSDKLLKTSSEYEDSIQSVCYAGDVMFNKLRPYLAKVIISPYNCFCTGEFLQFSSFDGDNRFLKYFMLSDRFIKIVNASTYGVKMPRANTDFIINLLMTYPPIEEQQQIANYLDEKCTGIDKIISKKKQQIETIENYKKSLIYEYVTGKKEI